MSASKDNFNKKGALRLLFIVAGIGAVVGGGLWAYQQAQPESTDSVTFQGDVNLGEDFASQDVGRADGEFTPPTNKPSADPKVKAASEIRIGAIPWSSQQGENLANGGPRTTQNSLMEHWGVNLVIQSQMMYDEQKAALIACAKYLKQNPSETDCPADYHIVTMMGDAYGWYISTLNEALKPLCEGVPMDECKYAAVGIGGPGRSLGEDAFMGPEECITNPDFCRGKRFAGVQGDGDINVAIAWANANSIPVNPNGTTFDPDAINFLFVGDFMDGDTAFCAGQTDELREVKNGKLTGRTVEVPLSGTCTWTPGDVNVTRQCGGITKIADTADFPNQMANMHVTIRGWGEAHKEDIARMFAATFEANLAIRQDPKVLKYSGQATYDIYRTEHVSAADWRNLYAGFTELDKTGELRVPLGGSQVFTLDEALAFYGTNPSTTDMPPNQMSYTYFGNRAVELWPEDLPEIPDYWEVYDPSYLLLAKQMTEEAGGSGGGIEKTNFSDTSGQETVFATGNWSIQFDSGKATFRDTRELDKLLELTGIAGDMVIEIHGHTDSQGNDESNKALSEARAFAVSQYLQRKASGTFPKDRLKVFSHGEDNPIAPNTTASGRALNRRVEVVLVKRDNRG